MNLLRVNCGGHLFVLVLLILSGSGISCNGELDERLYCLNDANFNVTALVNTSGTVVERYVYDPYGKVTIYNSDWSATVTWANSKKNEVLYCGYRYDPETGLYHVRNRMYHPTLGRWLQRDPGGYVDGMSLYEYVKSGPVARLDPFGLDDIRIKEGTTNIVQYMPERWWGGDVVGCAVDLGKVDKHGVVDFYDKFKLPPMPLEILEDYGSEDTIEELLQAIRDKLKARGNNNWGSGRYYSDYHDLRVTQAKADATTPLAAETDSQFRIKYRAHFSGLTFTKVAVPTVLGAGSAGLVAVIIKYAPGPWRLVAIIPAAYGAYEASQLGDALQAAKDVKAAAERAMKIYGDSKKIVHQYDSGEPNHGK